MFNAKKAAKVAMGILLLFLAACTNSQNEAVETVQPENEQQEAEKPTNEEQPEIEEPQVEQPTAPVEGMPPTALEAAATVMRLLENGDMENLASWVHPEKGLRFSPYAYVDIEKDIVFSRDEVKKIMDDPAKYIWRTYAGNGDLINMSYAEYHQKFVYDADFIGLAKISLNEGLGEGTTINNLNEIYPPDTHDFVEYHIDGIDPTYDGMDWRSLRLVFEKMGDDRILVGIIHDQWTP